MQLRVDGEGAETAEQLGASLLLKAAENYHMAEVEIAELMASLIGDGMTAEKFLGLSLDSAFPYFKELAQDPGFESFSKVLGRLR